MKTILILAAGLLQLPAITTARRLGLRVVAVDADAQAPGLSLANVARVANITDYEACLAIAREEHADGVIQICTEVSIPVIGRLNAAMGWAGLRPEVALDATNKHRMRRAFERGGAPSPRSFGCGTIAEALAAARSMPGALIAKPSRSSGSRGVTKLETGVDEAAVAAAFERAMGFSADRGVVIEEFVEGPEFSVEILVWNGEPRVLAVTDKVTTGSPNFVETGHSQPTALCAAERDAVVRAAIAGVKALGIDWSAAHAEIKLGATGPRIMEIGARLGGDFITTELVPRSTGVDMVAGAIRLALGEVPDLTPQHSARGAAIRYVIPRPGRITAVSGLPEARRLPSVRVAELYVGPDDDVPPVTSSGCRSGHVIAEGATAAEAIMCAEAGCAAIRIE